METLSQGNDSFSERSKQIAKSLARNILIAGSLSATAFSAAAIENDVNNVNLLDDNTYQQSVESYNTGESKIIHDSDYIIVHTQNLEYESLKHNFENLGVNFSDVEAFFDEAVRNSNVNGYDPNRNYVDDTNLVTNNGKEILLHNTSTSQIKMISNMIKQNNQKLSNITSKFIVQHELAHLEDTKALFQRDEHNFSNQHEIYADLKGIQKIFQSEDLNANERKQFLESIIEWRKSGTEKTVNHNIRDNHTTHFALQALADYYEENNYSMDSVNSINEKELYNFSSNIVQIDFTHNITQANKDTIINKQQNLLKDPTNLQSNPFLFFSNQATFKSLKYNDEGTLVGFKEDYKLTQEDIRDILSEPVNNGRFNVDVDFLAKKLEGKSPNFFETKKNGGRKNGDIVDSEAMEIFKESVERYYNQKETFTLDEPEVSLLSFENLSLQQNISSEASKLFQNSYNQERLSANYKNKIHNKEQNKSKHSHTPKPTN